MKKGQISLFIIVGIIIVVVVAIFIFVKKESLGFEKEKIDPDIQPIYDFVEGCIKETGEYGIYHIGQTGGYFISPDLSTEAGTAIYSDKGQNHMPSKEKVESELSSYIEDMIELCTGDFQDFPSFQVTSYNKTVETNIEDNQVIFDVEYPVSISKGEKTYTFKEFQEVEVVVRLGVVYNSIYEFIQDQITHEEDICVTCITDIAEKNDLYFEMLDYDEETVLFNIRDKNSKILDKEYVFKFANKY